MPELGQRDAVGSLRIEQPQALIDVQLRAQRHEETRVAPHGGAGRPRWLEDVELPRRLGELREPRIRPGWLRDTMLVQPVKLVEQLDASDGPPGAYEPQDVMILPKRSVQVKAGAGRLAAGPPRLDTVVPSDRALRTNCFRVSDQFKRERTRITIDVSPELRTRIKVAAAENGVSISEYLGHILEESVPIKNSGRTRGHPVTREAIERLRQIREAIMQDRNGKPFEDSTEIIRQMREERSRELGQL